MPTIRISEEEGGDNPSISMDGQYIAFEAPSGIYLHDMAAGTNTLIDTGTTPFISATGRFVAYVQGSKTYVWDVEEETKTPVGTGNSPSISADGRFVVFNSFGHVWIRDMQYGTIRRVSVLPNPADEEYNSFSQGYISADGRFTAFASSGTFLTGDPTPVWSGIYVRDLVQQETIFVSSDIGMSWPALSSDGRYVNYIRYNSENSCTSLGEVDKRL